MKKKLWCKNWKIGYCKDILFIQIMNMLNVVRSKQKRDIKQEYFK